MKRVQSTAGVLICLHLLLALYALSDVCSKAAAGTMFFSTEFLVLYGAILVLLAVYALGWQQVIKHLPLTTAYANRAITILWGMFWGCVLFGESITIGKVVGAIIIAGGIYLYVSADDATATAGKRADEDDAHD